MFPINDVSSDIQPETEDGSVTSAATMPEPSAKDKKRWAEMRQRSDYCKSYKKKLISNWSLNIDYRRGKPFASQSDDDNIAVNMDWTFTKTKHASLFSQVPKIRVVHSPESLQAPWVSTFERKLNDTLVSAGIESAMDEVMPDCINAAGFGVVLVAMETISVDKQVPSMDITTLHPQLQQEARQSNTINGQPLEMSSVPEAVDKRYIVTRVSPQDFLWDISFNLSNFDNSPLIGHSGKLPWAEAKSRFKLKDEDKNDLITVEVTPDNRISYDMDKERAADDDNVGYDELFYYDYKYDSDAKSFKSIHHLVFLHGKNEPVVDEPWKGQRIGPDGKVLGSLKRPLRVLTLAYISDEAIPPSDTAIGRAQVNELNKGRTQVIRQRERNIPSDWFDVNRLDPSLQQALMRGTWKHAIPVQGDGQRVIGSIPRSPMQQENFMFDKVAKGDLQEQWSIGANQTGGGADVETKAESNVIQTNFMTKVGRERAKVSSFVIGIAEVLGGLLCLYEDPQEFGQGFDPAFSQALPYSMLADSTVLVDANQRLEQLNNFVNTYAKTGLVDLPPVLKEIAALIGLDPSVIRTPPPTPPEQSNVSLRLTGGEDMMNPLLLAFLIKSGQAPAPELIEQAKKLIQQAVVEPAQQPVMPGNGPQGPLPPGTPMPSPELPEPPPPAIGEAHPDATILPTIGKRSDAPQG